MTDTEITIDPSNLALIDDIPIPTIGDNSDTNTVEYTDLADIIRHALLNIKTGQHKIFQPQRRERNHKFPCPICDKNCNENQQSIYCSQCNHWVHRKCNGTSKAEFDILSDEPDDVPFCCILCIIRNNAEIYPFGYLSTSEMLNLHGIDIPSQLSMLPSYTVCSKLTKLPNLDDFDMDENLIHAVDSRYVQIPELNELRPTKQSFLLFHMNIRSLSAHHDELLVLLSGLKFTFDIIDLSETKEQREKGFLSNVNLAGYNIHSQPTKSSNGGVTMYVKSSLNYKVREDLSVTKAEFEMICIELLNRASKNTLCFCTYRHPNTDVQVFLDHMYNVLQKSTKERKDIFFMGDFNLNLLNYDTHSETNDFVNLMMTHYILPHILHPTRVTDHSATIIDNIFTNTTEFNSKSGNILCEISDHFSQFIIVEKSIADYKSCSFAKCDFSSFNEGKFVDDYTSLDLDMLHKHDISIDNKFDYSYETLSNLVDKHVPSKKMTKKDIKLHSKPWITSKIVRLIRYRDRLKKKLKRKFTPDNEFLYKKFRN